MKKFALSLLVAALAAPAAPLPAQIVNPHFLQSGAGAVARTFQDKGRDVVSVKDFGAKGDGVTSDTAAITAALATGKSVSFPGGVYLTTGGHSIAAYGQRVIGAGVTDVAAFPSNGTVIKKSGGTADVFTVPLYTLGTSIENITFDQNSLGGSAIVSGGHSSILRNITVHNQGGTSYAIKLSGMNLSSVEGIRFSGACYGRLLLTKNVTADYGVLYTSFKNIFDLTSAITDRFMKIDSSSVLQVEHVYLARKGIYINNLVSSVHFRGLNAELSAQEALHIDGTTGGTLRSITVDGGALLSTADAGAIAFIRVDTALGVHLRNLDLADSASAVNRPYILHRGVLSGSVKNLYINNTSANAHYAVQGTGVRSDFIEIANVYKTAAGTVTLSLWHGNTEIKNSNLAVAFNAASQMITARNLSATVTLTNANPIILEGVQGVSGSDGSEVHTTYWGSVSRLVVINSAAALDLNTGASVNGQANLYRIDGTTGITSITANSTAQRRIITLRFEGILTVTDGNNLKLAGDFVTAAGATLTLVSDGTNWYELSRSTN